MKPSRIVIPALGAVLVAGTGFILARSAGWLRREPPTVTASPQWPLAQQQQDSGLVRAMAFEKDGKIAEAAAEYSKALEHEPGNWLALSGRASAYEQLGRDQDAIQDLKALSCAK